MLKPHHLIFAPLALLAACFNPEIQDGGFLCNTDGKCPEGFTCFAEGSQRVCRKEAPSLMDMGAPDRGDLNSGDLRIAEAGVDLPRVPDQFPDTPVFTCAHHAQELEIINQLGSEPGSFDLALREDDAPYFVFITAEFMNQQLKHTWIKYPRTVAGDTQVAAARATVAAAAVDTGGRLHVLYSDKDQGNSYVSIRDIKADIQNPDRVISWKQPTLVWASEATSLDITALGQQLYGAVLGADLYGFSYESQPQVTAPSACGPEISEADKFSFARVAAGGGRWTAAVHARLIAKDEFLTFGAESTTCTTEMVPVPNQGVMAGVPPAPLAMAYGPQGTLHMALVEAEDTQQGVLKYVTRGSNGNIIKAVSISEKHGHHKALLGSVDIAVDSTSTPHISYRSASNGLFWTKQVGSDWPATLISARPGTETRIKVSPAGSVHLAYDDNSSIPGSLFYTCR